LEAATQFVWVDFVEGSPERCPVGDILWPGIFECVTKRMIASNTAFEGFEGVALELQEDKCSGAFRRDRLKIGNCN